MYLLWSRKQEYFCKWENVLIVKKQKHVEHRIGNALYCLITLQVLVFIASKHALGWKYSQSSLHVIK